MTDAARTVARPDEAGTVARERFDEGGGLVGSGRPPIVATGDAHVHSGVHVFYSGESFNHSGM